METLSYELRDHLFNTAMQNNKLDQLREGYKRKHQDACEKLNYHQKILMTICKTCNPQEYIEAGKKLNKYESIAIDYSYYWEEVDEWTNKTNITDEA